MISVVIAVYNGERYIEKALHSVFSQTLPSSDYEVIVVNDGSTDNTLGILDKYKNKIKITCQSNQGLAATCNRGIQEAVGDYITRLDADDYFDKGLLSSTLKLLEAMPHYHCVYTDRYEVIDGNRFRVNTGEENIFNMIACGILFRREVFNKIGLYRDLLFEEYDLILRFFSNGLQGYYLRKPLYYYIKHKQSMTNQDNYWESGWKQLEGIWGKKVLGRYISIQKKAGQDF